MMRYSERYILSHSIDFFFRYREFPIMILTDGSYIPDILNDKVENQRFQHQTALLIKDSDYNNAIIYHDYKVKVDSMLEKFDLNIDYDFFSIYRDYASIGFYSYACTNPNGSYCGTYELVSYPKEGLETKMPLPIYGKLKNIIFDDSGKIRQFDL